jgi:hypothetical protein
VTPARADEITITEFEGAGKAFLVAKLIQNGQPPQKFGTIGGDPDLWTFTLPEGYTFSSLVFLELGEPELHPPGRPDLTNINSITFLDEKTMLWESDQPESGIGPRGNPIRSPGKVTGPMGKKLDVVFADVPEPSSTLSLLGIGLAGLASFARIRRTAK